jgi:hypothetical protein
VLSSTFCQLSGRSTLSFVAGTWAFPQEELHTGILLFSRWLFSFFFYIFFFWSGVLVLL